MSDEQYLAPYRLTNPAKPLPDGTFLLPVCTTRDRFNKLWAALVQGGWTMEGVGVGDHNIDVLRALAFINDPFGTWCDYTPDEPSQTLVPVIQQGLQLPDCVQMKRVNGLYVFDFNNCDQDIIVNIYDNECGPDLEIDWSTPDCSNAVLVTGDNRQPLAIVGPDPTPQPEENDYMAGEMKTTASDNLREGYLWCDGAAVSRTEYADLFAEIGTKFGAGDGSSTFNVPDMRGRVAVGAGQGSALTDRPLASIGGAETHTLSEAELPTHDHNVHVHRASAPSPDGNRLIMSVSGTQINVHNDGWWWPDYKSGNTGGDTAHNNMQPYMAINWIIKT